jgi:WD40 repeat protein
LWDVATRKRVHQRQTAHRGEVTAVQFAGKNRLVSAGRDNSLIVWDVPSSNTLAYLDEIKDRSGEVTYPGVSPDGRHVLFDQGRELRLLSLDSKQIDGRLTNPSEAVPFSGMAVFAPDGKTILTNGNAAGKLQLWRAPTVDRPRGAELRQLIWMGGVATCGAFFPDGSLAVTGTQDHRVLLWAMPEQAELDKRLSARLSLIEKALDTRSRQVRVWAELENPGWLISGQWATIVVPPQPAPPAPLSVR